MKIAVNASILDDKPSGLGIYTINVVSRLARIASNEGDELVIYTSYPEALGGAGENADLTIRKIPALVQPKYGKKAAFIRFVWNWAIFPRVSRNLDIVYSTTHHGLYNSCSRQVITVHDILSIMFPHQHPYQKWYFTYILPRILKKSAAIITVSNNTRQDIHDYYKVALEKIYVVYNGIDHHSRFKRMQDDRAMKELIRKYGLRKYLLIVGASYPHKNISKALQAFSKVNCIVPELELVVLGGRKEYIKTLKYEAKNLGLQRVRFLDYIPAEELPTFYSGATALIYPSLYEGFGLPPLEAMACGCPVIVSNTSSLPEVCGDAAYYIDPYSTESIAEAICRLSRDENLRNYLRQKGLERARLFTWEKTARGVYEVLKAVYRERGR